MKKNLLILPLISLCISPICGCSETEKSPARKQEDFNTLISSSIDDTFTYIYSMGSDTSSWAGVYGYLGVQEASYIDLYTYLPYEGIDPTTYDGDRYYRWEQYCYNELMETKAVLKDDTLLGYELSEYTDYKESDTSEIYYDGKDLYELDNKTYKTYPDYDMSLSDFTYPISYYIGDENDGLVSEFEYMLLLHDIGYDEWGAYTITGSLSKATSGNIKATLKATVDYDFYMDYGFFSYEFYLNDLIQLDIVYKEDGTLVSLDYTYEDLFYDMTYGEIDITSEYISYYEYDGDVNKPSWVK